MTLDPQNDLDIRSHQHVLRNDPYRIARVADELSGQSLGEIAHVGRSGARQRWH